MPTPNRKTCNDWIALIVLFALLISGLVIFGNILFGAEQQTIEDERNSVVHSQAPFVIDETDTWAMHSQDLPTKADVLEWHMNGIWGYSRYENGEKVEKLWTELPGGSDVWDKLYGIDHDSKAFDHV